MFENKPLVHVGVDDGAAETKIVVFDHTGIKTQVAIPSRARSGSMGVSFIGNLGSADQVYPCYETEGTQFVVGDYKESETAGFDGYPYSGMNRAIVAHALRVAGLAGESLHIGTGLPLSVYFRGAQANQEAIDKKKASLQKLVTATDGSPMARIIRQSVFPEGLAAFIDYAVDDQGELRVDLDNEVIGIIDIGGRTTDIAVVEPRGKIDHARSGSENIGVLDLVEAVITSLSKTLGVAVPAHTVMQALRTGHISAFGTKRDITDIIKACAQDVLQRILREIDRRLGDGVDLTRILLVGGGANVFGLVSEKYPHILIPEDPEFANARGFAKYLSLNA